MNGYIAVDFDKTLATYDHYRGSNKFGDPIPKMVNRIKKWLAEGKTVKIMTARVSNVNHDREEIIKTRKALEEWCLKHFGQKLEITCEKDFAMEVLYDDRAIGVVPNKGDLTTERLVNALELMYNLVNRELPNSMNSETLSEIEKLIKEYKDENS